MVEPSAEPRVLTEPQQEQALEVVRRYLAECYRSGEDLHLPTFRVVPRTYPPGQAPRGLRIPRRSEGTHSDPTPAEAIANIEGITVSVPEHFRVPAAVVTDLLTALPRHLYVPLWRIGVLGHAWYSTAQSLQVGQSTLKRRLDEALVTLCRQLYAEFWPDVAG